MQIVHVLLAYLRMPFSFILVYVCHVLFRSHFVSSRVYPCHRVSAMAAPGQENSVGAIAEQRMAKRARTVKYLEQLLSHEPPLGSSGMMVCTSYRLRLALRCPLIPPENPSIIMKAFQQLRQVRRGVSCGLPPYPGDGQPQSALPVPFRCMGPRS